MMHGKRPREEAGLEQKKHLFCNQCGKTIEITNGLAREDYVRITKSWGYFSEKDGRRDTFCLCESCYDEITSGFVLPITQEEQTELV